MRYSCVIVEEDKGLRDLLEEHLVMLSGISIAGSFDNVSDAKVFLENNTTDILFTDTRHKEFIDVHTDSFLPPPPNLVFTTYDAANAQTGFELDAIDCLVKPFTAERILKTMEKIKRRLQTKNTRDIVPDAAYCFVKTDHNFTKIEFSKINYVEGLENYVKICCENKTVLALSTMKSIEAALASYHFLRIHRSYLVNLDKVDSVLNYNFYVGDKVLPVGRSYRKTITDTLKQEYPFPF